MTKKITSTILKQVLKKPNLFFMIITPYMYCDIISTTNTIPKTHPFKITYLLQLDIVADKQGNTLEITFSFRSNDPVMTKFDPDRLYQLEQNLKKILKLNPSKADSSIKNMKYIQAISYKDLK